MKRHGAGSITTNRIAEVAGVSIGSLYQYFPDKRSIFDALHERHIGDVRSMLERHIDAHQSSSFNESVLDLVEALVDLHGVQPELHQLVATSVNEGPEHFRQALRSVFEQDIARYASEKANRILFVLPSLVEGVVHGVASSPNREAKGEAIKATAAYLSAHPELGR